MRKYVTPSEVPAILGMDKQTSPWAIWNRMTEPAEDRDINDYGRWQGRLAAGIMQGIAKDHGLKVEKALDPVTCENILPQRAWMMAPNSRSNGQNAIMVVAQRTQGQLFGWTAPGSIPTKHEMKLAANAIAYGVDYVYYGVLVDGYRSELFVFHVTDEIRETVSSAITEMIRMVEEDDEPVVDYDADRSSIRKGESVASVSASAEKVSNLAKERINLKEEVASLNRQTKPKEKRIDEIDTMLIHMLANVDKIDCGDHIVSVDTSSNGTKKVIITPKQNSAASLF